MGDSGTVNYALVEVNQDRVEYNEIFNSYQYRLTNEEIKQYTNGKGFSMETGYEMVNKSSLLEEYQNKLPQMRALHSQIENMESLIEKLK